jgi:hypothetical protein
MWIFANLKNEVRVPCYVGEDYQSSVINWVSGDFSAVRRGGGEKSIWRRARNSLLNQRSRREKL